MENQDLQLKGTLFLEKFDAEGNLVETRRKDNIIVNGGFDFICDAIASSGRGAIMGYIGVGTSVTAPVASDTALGAQLVRQSATYAHTAGTKVFTLSSTFAAGVATGAITEAGVFNAVAAGTMLDRVTFSVINKGVDDTLTATFQFTLS